MAKDCWRRNSSEKSSTFRWTTLPDEEQGKDELEDEVLDENNSHHLQDEKKPSLGSQVIREKSAVDVDQNYKEKSLVQSDHIMILSPRDRQSPLGYINPAFFIGSELQKVKIFSLGGFGSPSWFFMS